MEDEYLKNAGLKDSITSTATIESVRMTERRVPTMLSDLYFSKGCTIFYGILSLVCVALLIICCVFFKKANGII